MSTSLWGRELKVHRVHDSLANKLVDLLVRSWIERTLKDANGNRPDSRPPCEVVNWKITQRQTCLRTLVDLLVRSWIERSICVKRKRMTRSTSLWGRELKGVCDLDSGYFIPSTSLWGRELKDLQKEKSAAFYLVDLLVRSWIERSMNWKLFFRYQVDLLVRSWIERSKIRLPTPMSSCRPPCEVVNWKTPLPTNYVDDILSTSLWGRELKDQQKKNIRNWNTVDLLVRSWIERLHQQKRHKS